MPAAHRDNGRLQRLAGLAAVGALVVGLLAVAPPASGGVLARHFGDVAVGVDFGKGVGVYDAGVPPAYCFALLSHYVGLLPVRFYYEGLRYFPGWAGSVEVPVGLAVALPPPLNTCFGLTGPGQAFRVDLAEADLGVAAWSQHLLGPTQVANLANTWLAFEYCEVPTAVGVTGVPGLAVGAASLFMADWVVCSAPDNKWTEDYQVYPGCHAFTMGTAFGVLGGDQPVFLVDGRHDEKLPAPPPPPPLYGSCNTLVRSGQTLPGVPLALLAASGVDYLVQSCLLAQLLDGVTGVLTEEWDSDHFVVGHNGALLPWALAPGPVGGPFFPNVSNLAWNTLAPSCGVAGANGEDWGVDQASGIPGD